MGVVIALPDHAHHDLILAPDLTHMGDQFRLGHGRPIQGFCLSDRGRKRLVNQVVQIGRSNPFKHRLHFSRRWPDMAAVAEIGGVIIDRGPWHRAGSFGKSHNRQDGLKQAPAREVARGAFTHSPMRSLYSSSVM